MGLCFIDHLRSTGLYLFLGSLLFNACFWGDTIGADW